MFNFIDKKGQKTPKMASYHDFSFLNYIYLNILKYTFFWKVRFFNKGNHFPSNVRLFTELALRPNKSSSCYVCLSGNMCVCMSVPLRLIVDYSQTV